MLRTRLTVIAMLVASGCGGGSTPATPTSSSATSSTSASSSSSTPASAWTPEGARLTNATTGCVGVLADTSTIQLTDGRWRMYMYCGTSYRSATSADGLSFAMDPGPRLPEGQGQARAVRLPDGRMRIFNSSGGGIASSVSGDDGLTFVAEPGLRVRASDAGESNLSGPSNIVRTADGLWRMYFSDLPIPGAGVTTHRIFSAASSDLFTWTMDPGVRVGAGAPSLAGNGEHPGAIQASDGSIALFYFRNSSFQLMTSTSRDGLSFTTESDTGVSTASNQANDPDLVRLSSGLVRMYHNQGDSNGGVISSATRAGL